MHDKIRTGLASVCGIIAMGALISTLAEAAAPPPVAPATQPDLTRAEALKIIAESRLYVAHPGSQPANRASAGSPVTTPAFDMPLPPPAPRAETKPPAPQAGLVWVPGHYMPVVGSWRWVLGEWAVPATPISIWIPANYDAKAKKWSPGYWQPDVTDTPTAESTPTPATPAPGR